VAVSRVTLRVHHVGDVAAGAALGLAGAIAATAILG
jgi:membrane-associated phospholipid phosphatase